MISWSAGDWLCGACQHTNFKKRETCQKCNFPKHATQAERSSCTYNNVNRVAVLAGDWYCHCGAHNYASRTGCFRCGNIKSDCGGYEYDAMTMMGVGGHTSEQAQLLPGWKAGDWICVRPGCGLHNYACRTECYKCRTPRDSGAL